jgi:hypothetical protein
MIAVGTVDGSGKDILYDTRKHLMFAPPQDVSNLLVRACPVLIRAFVYLGYRESDYTMYIGSKTSNTLVSYGKISAIPSQKAGGKTFGSIQ